jgi:hypothetical protein
MVLFSGLDLAPVTEGGTAADAFHSPRDLARHVERLGYAIDGFRRSAAICSAVRGCAAI